MAPNIVNFSSENLNSKNKDEERLAKVKKKIINYQNYIKKNLEYVGENFAYEARLIHYKDKNKAKGGIYGNASLDQLKELKEEGIETEIVPWINEKDN